jgi:hypothetical protein
MTHIDNPGVDGSASTGLEGLGTPENLRAQYPPTDPAPIQSALDPHKIDASESHERRRGLAGAWDSIAYHAQLVLLSIYGAGQTTREADPIERLKRKYGRAPRKH